MGLVLGLGNRQQAAGESDDEVRRPAACCKCWPASLAFPQHSACCAAPHGPTERDAGTDGLLLLVCISGNMRTLSDWQTLLQGDMFTALAGRTSSGKRRAPNHQLGKEALDLLEVGAACWMRRAI